MIMMTNSISLLDILRDNNLGGNRYDEYSDFVNTALTGDIDYLGDLISTYCDNNVPIAAVSIFDTVLKQGYFESVEEIMQETGGKMALLETMQKGIARAREEEMMERGAEIGVAFLEKELGECFIPEDKETQAKEYLDDWYEVSGMYRIAKSMSSNDFEYGKLIDHMYAFLGDMEEVVGIHIINERRDMETFKKVLEVSGDRFEFTVNHHGEIKCRKNGNETSTCCSFHETDFAVMFADAQIVKAFGSESRICGIRVPQILYNELKEEVRNQIKKSMSRFADLNRLKTFKVKAFKEKQFEIIKQNNHMTDDYHVGIRTIRDIKSFEEAMKDDESFCYGDFRKEDAERAIREGKITIYSSKPIEQGGFVTTSYNMAKDYAGSGKVYSKTVELQEVAWINGDEGQYANIHYEESQIKKSQYCGHGR